MPDLNETANRNFMQRDDFGLLPKLIAKIEDQDERNIEV